MSSKMRRLGRKLRGEQAPDDEKEAAFLARFNRLIEAEVARRCAEMVADAARWRAVRTGGRVYQVESRIETGAGILFGPGQLADEFADAYAEACG